MVMLEPGPVQYTEDIILLDGSSATIRPIRPEDRNALADFHNRLSEDTRFLRYQYSKGQLTEEDLKNFCDLDNYNTLGLVAERGSNAPKEIIGVGRYCRLPDDHTAEVAFVIQDSEQRKGIGTQLLKHLSILAWQRGISTFVAEVLRGNGKMLSIFRKSDPQMDQLNDGSTCSVKLSVRESPMRNSRNRH
jgi:RimJ/RimL family protein N-acetyltransferase